MRLRKIFQFLLIGGSLISAQAANADLEDNILPQNLLFACTLLEPGKQQRCITNTGDFVRSKINEQFNLLKHKDRIYFLNTRAKDAENAKLICTEYSNEIDKSMCITKINILMLKEIEARNSL